MYVSCSGLVMAKTRYPTLAESLKKIAELGFEAFDLDAIESWQHVNPSSLVTDPQATDALVGLIEASGLYPSSFNCGLSQPLMTADSAAFEQYEREFKALLELAARLDCPNITLQPGGRQQGRSDAEMLAILRDHLQALGEIAQRYPVTVSIENHAHSPVEDPEVVCKLIEAVWPAVGVSYDPSHIELQGIPLPASECLLPYTRHAHVRNAKLGEMQATMAEGTVDFDWLVEALRRHGYQGGVAIEYFSDFDPDCTSTLALKNRLVTLGVRQRRM